MVVHCRSRGEAEAVLKALRGRLADCGLELHPTKTKIVYCKDDDRKGGYEQVTFDFLGYTFQPRRARNRWGRYFVSFSAGDQQSGCRVDPPNHPRVADGGYQEQPVSGGPGPPD